MTAAVLFQNMPPLSREEYEALETSIREHGIQVPIVVDENRVVIDGHHRQKIAQELGIECPKRVVFDKSDAEKRTLALSLNLDRRHLSREQRRELIAESIKADPQLSNRQHADRVGASHVTVGTVREELESTGQIDQSETRLSADGRERPSTQPPRPTEPELMAGAEWTPDTPAEFETKYGMRPDEADALVSSGIVSTREEFDAAARQLNDDSPARAITGMDGKTYTQPQPRKTHRRALADDADDAGWALNRSIERLQKIFQDDRYNRNKEEVATKLRGHLLNTVEVCQDLLDQLPEQEI